MRFDAKEALKLYVIDELTAGQVAERMGVSRATMTIFLREKGVIRFRGGQAMFNEDKMEEIIKYYKESGESASSVATKYGCSTPVIQNILSAKGVQRNPSRLSVRIFTSEEKEKAFKMRREGVCVSSIAKSLHTGKKAAEVLLGITERKTVIPRTGPKGPRLRCRRFSQKQEKQMVSEYESGVTILDLAKRWNTCHTLMRNIIRRNGVEIRRKYGVKKAVVIKNHLNHVGFRTPRGKEIEN